MAALSALPTPTSPINAWQKVFKFLSARNLGNTGAASSLKWLQQYMLQKRNPDLYFAPFTAAQVATANDGHGVGAGTAQLYAIYFVKKNTAVDSFASVVDDGTDDNYYGGSLTGSVRVQAALLEALDEFVAVYPNGLSIANGLRVVATTAAAAGTTASAAADGPDGFLIFGA